MGRGAWAAHRVELLLEELVHDDVGGARREGEQRPYHLHVLVLQRNLQREAMGETRAEERGEM